MKNIYRNPLVAHSQGRLVWIVALSIWLLGITVSNIHAQEHVFLDDYQCQLCLSSFKDVPINTSDNSPLLSIKRVHLLIEHKMEFQISNQPLTIFNRGPPKTSS